jgi:hypothetical protein
MKTYGGVDVEIHVFLTSALAEGEWSASRFSRFIPGERASGAHSIGGWVGLRAGLDDMEERKNSSARSPSQYRLSYPSSLLWG